MFARSVVVQTTAQRVQRSGGTAIQGLASSISPPTSPVPIATARAQKRRAQAVSATAVTVSRAREPFRGRRCQLVQPAVPSRAARKALERIVRASVSYRTKVK